MFLKGHYRGCKYQSGGVSAAPEAFFWRAEAKGGVCQKLQESGVLIGRSEVGKGFADTLGLC